EHDAVRSVVDLAPNLDLERVEVGRCLLSLRRRLEDRPLTAIEQRKGDEEAEPEVVVGVADIVPEPDVAHVARETDRDGDRRPTVGPREISFALGLLDRDPGGAKIG